MTLKLGRGKPEYPLLVRTLLKSFSNVLLIVHDASLCLYKFHFQIVFFIYIFCNTWCRPVGPGCSSPWPTCSPRPVPQPECGSGLARKKTNSKNVPKKREEKNPYKIVFFYFFKRFLIVNHLVDLLNLIFKHFKALLNHESGVKLSFF